VTTVDLIRHYIVRPAVAVVSMSCDANAGRTSMYVGDIQRAERDGARIRIDVGLGGPEDVIPSPVRVVLDMHVPPTRCVSAWDALY
jgi:hypothetical protein